MALLMAVITAKGFHVTATAVAGTALLLTVTGVTPIAVGLPVAAVSGLVALRGARRSREQP